MLTNLAVNLNARIREEKITDTRSCVIVDDVLANPEDVVQFAQTLDSEFEIPEHGYPGRVLDIQAEPMADLYRFLRSQMSRRFGFLRGGIRFSTVLSMTTRQPEELSNLQRICHTDPRIRVDRVNYASVLYLFSNERLGGTAFYDWKEQKAIEEATALELEDPDKSLEFLQARFETYRQAPCYLTQTNEIAEKLAMIPAKYNRLIFYSGDLPHSAWIAEPALLSSDPAVGRLTLNCFASVRPR